MDPVLGVDVHFELVPMPAPTPTPIPNPFTGVVFDPVGLAVGLVIGAAVSAVLGAPIQGPVLYWTAFPATNTGTEAKHVPGHIIIPPGTGWAPFPKTPKPVIHPGETPEPPNPVSPENDAVVIFGSKTVTVMGSNAVRLGDIALSCGEPVRLPSSVVLAVPKGAPILIGGPPSLDIMAAILASLRTRFISDSLHAALSRLKPSRFRNFLNRAVCFLTGHPVDVATGRVLTDAVDAELPGPLPMKVERVYSSAFGSRKGPLGHGWSWSLDQAVWRERGAVVQLAEDGREIEFDTFELVEHQIAPGQAVRNDFERSTLYCERHGRFRIAAEDGVTRHYAPVPGRTDGRAMIQRIVSRCGNHEIAFRYDERGRLAWVYDSGGRAYGLRWDVRGFVAEVYLPPPSGEGHVRHRQYSYDAAGDLVAITDSRGGTWRFEYAGHLLVRETDRNGMSWYFQYDGMGEDAWCVRTWGDGGELDHVIGYDKGNKVTFVTDSLGNTVRFFMNPLGQVIKTVDALGGEAAYEYDPKTLQRVSASDAFGSKVASTYDDVGRLATVELPEGSRIELEYTAFERPTTGTDVIGGQWAWDYDRVGNTIARRTPDGVTERYGWDKGLPSWEDDGLGNRSRFEHDAAKNLVRIERPNGAEVRRELDGRGRRTARIEADGGRLGTAYDTEGNLVRVDLPTGDVQRFTYDAENNLVLVEAPGRRVEYRYSLAGRMLERVEADATIRLGWDTEGNLVETVDEAGNRRVIEIDPGGNVAREIDPDGVVREYLRDEGGRVSTVFHPSGKQTHVSYDVMSRIAKIEHSDGTFVAFERGADGALLRAENETGTLHLERDVMGRVVKETFGGHHVTSWFRGGEARVAMETSLGAKQKIDRDALGQHTALDQGATPLSTRRTTVRRDALGRETEHWFGDSLFVKWDYDAGSRETVRRVGLHADGGTRDLEVRQWGWGGWDRLAWISDSETGTWELKHDRRQRLIQQERAEDTLLRVLDATGNVYERADGSDRAYDACGRIVRRGGTHYRHDEDGQLVERVEPDGATWRFSWNGHGLLTAVERPDGDVVRFEYDAMGRRTRKLVTREEAELRSTAFVWDDASVVHELPSDAHPITWLWSPESFSPDVREQAGIVDSVIVDHLGTPTAMFDSAGNRRWRMDLDALGHAVFEGLPSDCPWRWPGQYEDEETGLYYNRWRYFDPDTQQYLSADPLGLLAGLHFYAYVADPFFGIDPWGLVNVRNLGDHQLFEHIHEVMYRNKRAHGGAGRHGIIHRVREQITGAMRPGSTGWGTHEDEIKRAQQNLRDALDEWDRRGLPQVDRHGDDLFPNARRLSSMDAPTGREADVPKVCK